MRLHFHIASRNILPAILLCFTFSAFSQEREFKSEPSFYVMAEFAAPLTVNPDFGNEDEPFLILNGASIKAGAGRQFLENTFYTGLHTGMEWKASPDLFSVPIYANFKFSPNVTYDDNWRPFASFGYGRVFSVERHLSGAYVLGNFGIDFTSFDDFLGSFYIEISNYAYRASMQQKDIATLNIGIALTFY